MLVNFYYVDGEDYDNYQSIMENSEDGFKVLYCTFWSAAVVASEIDVLPVNLD